MNPKLSSHWRALSAHADRIRHNSLSQMFEQDKGRAQRFSADAAGLFVDYSKNLIDEAAWSDLIALAQSYQLAERRDAMFTGEKINNTEQRAVLHTALRALGDKTLVVDRQDVIAPIRTERERLYAFARAVRQGAWRGISGQAITDVVNIGIGGSDLGPLMVCEALKASADGPRAHFVSNVDGFHIQQTLRHLNPATTLFIVASKTFTTVETLTNARTARAWLTDALGAHAVAQHFVAVSTARDKVTEFGIDPDNMFGFWDWVGGRYSLWSAIGLPIVLSIGPEGFDDLLAGAYDLDEHFRSAPPERNLPVILGLLGVWYTNFLGAQSHVVAPYSQALHRLPAFLQQLDMESNGKSIQRDGAPVQYSTGPVIWGEPGTNGQHAFFQLLHQGTALIPVDFILPLSQPDQLPNHQRTLVANCLAQAAALAKGKTAEEVRTELSARGMKGSALEEAISHRVFSGNRPSNMLLLKELTPRSLGALLALYEHKVFVQGVIWNLNSFDQWGVELGKQLATGIEKALIGEASTDAYDASTQGLIERAKAALAASGIVQ